MIRQLTRMGAEGSDGGGNGGSGNINLSGSRWSNPVGGPSPNLGDPATVTWSIVPDGTQVTNIAGGLASSNLISFMDGIYGGGSGPVENRPWFGIFAKTYDTWSSLSGLKFVYEPQDDGAPYQAASRGVAGVRGDVRIGGARIDGDFGILAFNFYPNGSGDSGTDGDMVIDTADRFYRDSSDGPTGENRALFNVLAHESGHGIGLGHVIPTNETKLMEPFISVAFSGPQHDDIIAAQTVYGDDFENNDTRDTASNLGVVTKGTTQLRNLSIDRSESTDLFSFTLVDTGIRSIRVVPQGFEYSVGPQGGSPSLTNSRLYRDLSFQIEKRNGDIIASAASQPSGIAEIINNPGLSAGTYLLRINGTPGETQLFDLVLEGGGSLLASSSDGGPRLIGVQPNNSELIENGAIRTVSPRELTFRFDDKQVIDPKTTSGIRVSRAGGDGSFGLPSASSDFGSNGRVDIQLTSKMASEPLNVSVTVADLGTSTSPQLSMVGSNVSIVLNSRIGSRVTGQSLVNAINAAGSPVASKLTARINGGWASAPLGEFAITSPVQLSSSNDQVIVPGAVIIGDTPNENEVTLRFAENLPDDLYRLEIFGFDDPGRGVTGLRNVDGGMFVPSDPKTRQDTIEFRLDLGSKIIGVVPQPVQRLETGALKQDRDTIVIYFDDEKMFAQRTLLDAPVDGSVEDPKFYQLVETQDTVRNTDDFVTFPERVTYNASANTVTLKFAGDIDNLRRGGSKSTFRLRVGTKETIPSDPIVPTRVSEVGTSFDTAESLNTLAAFPSTQTSLLLRGEIDPENHQLDQIGSNLDPGTRRVPEAFENFINPNFTGDRVAGIRTLYYNFQTNYGSVGTVAQTNAISEKQKARIREAFSLWSDRIGVQFVETPNSGLTMALGALGVLTGPNVQRRDSNFFGVRIDPNFQNSLAVFSADNSWKDNYGEDFTRAAAASIGLLLGLANAGDADPSTLMNFDDNFINGGTDRNFEPIFPGNLDVIRGSFLHRPESSDIDLYRFDVPAGPLGALRQGAFVAEVLAERQASSSPLDARLALFKQTQASAVSNLGAGGSVEVVFTAVAPGKLGNNLQIFVTRSNRGLGQPPSVTTFPNAIVIDLNSTANSESTLGDLITALSADPSASALVSITPKSGDLNTKLGNREITYSPIVLSGGSIDLIAQNDDYYGKDSLLRMNLTSGRYYIGVSASGNDKYDASIPDTGWGGRTQGQYDLRLTYRAQIEGSDVIRDVSNQPNDLSVPLDGDADGRPGGVYDFWFDTRPLDRALNFNAGASTDLVGKIVTITGFSGVVRRFEFSTGGAIGSGNTRVLITPTSNAVNLAAALANAINSRPELGVTATASGTRVILKGERLVQLSPNLSVIDLEGKTIFVDKSAGQNADGSEARPFNNISGSGVPNAFAASIPGDIIRIVGNGGNDGKLETVGDNFAYEIGFGLLAGSVLADGQTMDIPKGVAVMVDSGAIFKLRRARIGVGSSTIGVDRSGGALQVLGTPKLLNSSGNPLRNGDGSLASGTVFFTSWLDEKTGFDNYLPTTTPAPGDWGGILFKRDLDKSVGRPDLEDEGIFKQYVNFADLRYGGSSAVVIDSVQQTVNSIQISDMRPTVTFNRISLAADSAISASPDSFEETLFSDPRYQRKGSFTPEYDRVGPKIHGNQLINNSINGMFIKVSTPAGGAPRQLTVAGRFDDTDVVHVLAENVSVQGNPGGGLLDTSVIPSNLVSFQSTTGGTLAVGTYRYKLTFVDSNGYETPPSAPTAGFSLSFGQTAIRIAGLPGVGSDYVSRRLYRNDGSSSEYRLVAELDGNTNSYLDRGALLADSSDAGGSLLRDQPDVSGVSVTPTTSGAIPGFLPSPGLFTYRIVMVDSLGRESIASAPTVGANTSATNRTIALDNLPRIQLGYSSLRIYRSSIGGAGVFSQIAEITDPTVRSFTDNGTAVPVRPLSVESLGNIRPRLDASLAIDPGTIIKLEGARIEFGHSTQLLAEGSDGNRIVMTSRQDDRFGAGGTFDTNNNGLNGELDSKPGDWSGIYAQPGAYISLDHVVLANAGGVSRIEGTFKAFSPIELQQAGARISNSVFEENANGMGGQGPIDRLGRPANENYPLGNNASRGSTVFVRGSQPIFLNNIFQNNAGTAITIDINSMDAELRGDTGRQTGSVGRNLTLDANRGPLFRGNRLFNNGINGLEIRADAATNNRDEDFLSVRDLPRNNLNTESVWDDTDIVHVLFDSVVVSNLQQVGGLRLQSAVNESLVIKMDGQGSNFDHERGTGFTATGRFSSITDRVGGTIQVLGMPGFPVVFTSLRDDSVGAGTQPNGLPQTDTNNDGIGSIPRAGDWRSLVFDSYSNDRNVRAVNETERPNVSAPGVNDTTITSQFLGTLARNPSNSDENLVLGWTINGVLSEPGDQDVYSFTGIAGTEVWFDIDGTTLTLDTVLEILNSNGDLLARSDDSTAEQLNPALIVRDPLLSANAVNPIVQRDRGSSRRHESGLIKEYGTTNESDAGLLIVLPGVQGASRTFFFRVRSKGTDIENTSAGLTSGSYTLQVRQRDQQEFAGSTVQYADIRYATNGVHTLGLPYASPLTGEAHSGMFDANTNSVVDLGPLHLTSKGAISVAGQLPNFGGFNSAQTFSFTVGDLSSTYVGSPSGTSTYPVVIDIDYADGLNRASLQVDVFFDADSNPLTPGTPVSPLTRDRALIVDDLPRPLAGNDLADLSRGSVGTGDSFLSFIGTAELRRGTYQVVVSDRNPAQRRSGTYQMEIRVGDEIGTTLPRFYRGSYSTSIEFLTGLAIPTGSKVDVSDGANRLTFEFTTTGSVDFGNVPVLVATGDSPSVLAGKFRDAINQVFQQNILNVRAADRNRNVTGASNSVIDLFGNVEVYDPSNVFTVAGVSGVLRFDGFGDLNSNRDQGQFIVSNTIVTKARDYAVWAAPAEKYYADGRAQPFHDSQFFPPYEPYSPFFDQYTGAPTLGGAFARNLPVENVVEFGEQISTPAAVDAGIAPGLVVVNNIFDSAGMGGLHIQGETPTWRITAFPAVRDSCGTNACNAAGTNGWFDADHSGTTIDDRDLMDVTFGRNRVRFEFEDIAGGTAGGPVFGSGVVGGNGWNPENIPIYYREDTGAEYLRVPNGATGYGADEVIKAIRDAFLGSVLGANGTTQRISTWIEPQADPIIPPDDDPANPAYENWTHPSASMIIKGPQNIAFLNTIGNPNPLLIQRLGEFTAAPFVRAVNNTIIGNDGRASLNPEVVDSDSNDTIRGAAQTFQGIGVNPQNYNVNGTLTADPLSTGSSDVDFYKFQMEIGDRVRIDVDAPRGSTLDSALRLFDSSGIAQVISNESDPTTSNNRSAPGEPAGLDPYIDFTATKPGVYYVAVSASGNTQYDPYSFAGRRRGETSGSYSLSIQVLKPEQFVIVADAPETYADGETFTIQQVADLSNGTNARTFEFTRNAGYNGGNIPIYIGPNYRVPDMARAIAFAITASGMDNAQSLPNGIFGTANPLAPVSAIAPGGENGFDPSLGYSGPPVGLDVGINSGNVRGPEVQAGLNRVLGSTNDRSPFDFNLIIREQNAVTSSVSQFFGHADQGLGHDRTMSLPVLPTVDRPVTSQGNGTSEKFVVVRNAYSITSSNPGRRIAGRAGTNNMNQIFPETGIMVSGGASPTLLNNTFVNVQSPIIQERPIFLGSEFRPPEIPPFEPSLPSARPSAVVVGGNPNQYAAPATPITSLGQFVEANPTNVPNTGADFNFTAGNGERLFVDFPGSIFLPNPQSQIIDSSIDSLPEREGFRAVKQAVGIAPSPVLAPDRDFYGLLRADDPSVAPPSGLGGSVFKDRGAIDRADFFGPSAIAVNPVDNDARRVDVDPTASVIELSSGVYPEFRIQLQDGFEFANLGGGTGIDDNSVVGSESTNRSPGAVVTITENNRLLVEGIDYVFSYNTTTNEIVLKPLAGVWRNDRVYDITINNKDRFVIDAVAGDKRNDGDSFVIRDSNGNNVTFEFDSGFRLQLPIGLQLNLPAAGGGAGGVADGERFSITVGGSRLEFEFDNNNSTVVTRPEGIIRFTSLSSKAQLADAIVAAINSSFSSGVSAKKLDSNDVFIAAPRSAMVQIADSPALAQPAETLGLKVPSQGGGIGGVVDGQSFSVSDGERVLFFEFDSDPIPSVQPGNIRITVNSSNSSLEVAQAIESAIKSSGLKVSPSVFGNDIVHLGLPSSGRIELINTTLAVVGVARSVQDGDTLTISRDNGGTSTTFEFDNNGTVGAGRIRVPFTNSETQSEIGATLATAIRDAGIGLNPKHFGNGSVVVGGLVSDSISTSGAPTVAVIGSPGVQDKTVLQILGTLNLLVPSKGGSDPALLDNSIFTITNRGATVRFEFDGNFSGASAPGNEVIRFTTASTQSDLVASIVQAINAVTRLGVVARPAGIGRIDLGLLPTSAVNLLSTPLSLERGLPKDGDFFTIVDGTRSVTFEFANSNVNNTVGSGNVSIPFSDANTVEQVYGQLKSVLFASALRLDSDLVMSGTMVQGLKLKDTSKFVYNIDNAGSLKISGVPGGTIAIPYTPDASFTAAQMREAIIRSINKAASDGLTSLSAKFRGGSTLFVENAITIGPGVSSFFLRGVQDVAGNFLKSNRINNETPFKILMPGVVLDYGDAPDPTSTTRGRYATLKENDGARHVVRAGELRLGSSVSSETDGKPQPLGDGDNGDDGVSFRFQRNDYGSSGSPIFNKNVFTDVTVTMSAPGVLNAWIDFNADGDWADPGENVLQDELFDSSALTRTFQIRVPASAPNLSGITQSFARFRASTSGGLSPSGLALDGEVEDYRISLVPGAPPVGVNDTYTINEDSGTLIANDPLDSDGAPFNNGVLANDGNPDGRTLTATLLSNPQFADRLEFNPDGTFAYFPLDDFFGVDTFVYLASDSIFDSLTRSTVTITVRPVNDPPIAGPLTFNINEDTVLEILSSQILAVSSPGPANESSQTLTITGVDTTSVAGGSVVFSGGKITYTPTKDFSGSDRFTYRIRDNGETGTVPDPLETVGTITINVADKNDPPITVPKTLTTAEGQSVDISISSTDLLAGDLPGPANEIAAGQTLTFTGVQPTSTKGGQVAIVGTKVVYTPPQYFNGTDTFFYIVTDNGFSGTVSDPQSALGTVTVTVTPVNDAPMVVKPFGTVVMTEDQTPARTLLLSEYFIDPDIATNGDSLTYRVVSNTNTSLIEPTFQSGQLVLLPKPDQNGSATIVIEARDVAGQTVTNTLTVQVTAVPDAPRLVSPLPDRTVAEDSGPIVIQLSPDFFFDPDVVNGDVLSFTVASSNTDVATVVAIGSTMTVSLKPNAFGTTTISVTARDISGASVSDSFVLTVTPVNDNPVAVNDSYSMPQGEIFRTTDPTGSSTTIANDNGVLANDTDVEGDLLTAELTLAPTRGTVVVNANGTFVYTPGPTAVQGTTDTFKYRAKDAFGGISNEATVTITIGQALPSRYQNPANRMDVDADGFVSALDVLIIINLINSKGSGWNGSTSGLPGPPDYVDVDGDKFVTPLDVLDLINFINAGGTRSSSGGEGEGSSDDNAFGWSMDVGRGLSGNQALLPGAVGDNGLGGNLFGMPMNSSRTTRSQAVLEESSASLFGLPTEDEDFEKLACDVVGNDNRGSQDIVDQVFADLFND
ncbi:MAG: tandem-95 repeat protein [Planctomycetota bacterium]